MRGHLYNVGRIADTTINAAPRTLAQIITPSSRRAWITELSLSGKSVNPTDVPVKCYFIKQTTAGTTGASITPEPRISGFPASLCTVNVDFSGAEPTSSGGLRGGPWYYSPVGGLWLWQVPIGDEIEMAVSERLGLVVETAQSTAIAFNFGLAE